MKTIKIRNVETVKLLRKFLSLFCIFQLVLIQAAAFADPSDPSTVHPPKLSMRMEELQSYDGIGSTMCTQSIPGECFSSPSKVIRFTVYVKNEDEVRSVFVSGESTMEGSIQRMYPRDVNHFTQPCRFESLIPTDDRRFIRPNSEIPMAVMTCEPYGESETDGIAHPPVGRMDQKNFDDQESLFFGPIPRKSQNHDFLIRSTLGWDFGIVSSGDPTLVFQFVADLDRAVNVTFKSHQRDMNLQILDKLNGIQSSIHMGFADTQDQFTRLRRSLDQAFNRVKQLLTQILEILKGRKPMIEVAPVAKSLPKPTIDVKSVSSLAAVKKV